MLDDVVWPLQNAQYQIFQLDTFEGVRMTWHPQTNSY